MRSVRSQNSKVIIKSALGLFTKQQIRKLTLLLFAQVALGLLDLVGVALFGLVGALAVAGVRFSEPNGFVTQILTFLHFNNFSFQSQVALLGMMAASILLLKTVLAIYLTRKTISFLGQCGKDISTNLMAKLLNTNLSEIRRHSIQSLTYILTGGVESVTVGILGSLIGLVVDCSLLMLMVGMLFTVQPLTAIATLSFFSLVSGAAYLFLNKRSTELGINASKISIESDLRINESFSSFREITVRGARPLYLKEFESIRSQAAKISSEMQFLPNISKYILETSVVFGAILVAAVQFMLTDANSSIATLAIFIMSSSRIAPAALRIQQNAISLKSAFGKANLTFDLFEHLEEIPPILKNNPSGSGAVSDFSPEINIDNLTFTYQGNSEPSLQGINLEIKPGSFVAIVGPSGSGKSTLVDCMLGLQNYDSGTVLISGHRPIVTFDLWPNEVSYVPQEVHLLAGDIRSNVALGYPLKAVSDELVLEALEKSKLIDYLNSDPEGLNKKIGPGETSLSGGQRQRLGIARALYAKPRILFLDEATSALDGSTEASISAELQALKGKMTIIVIAHRLSTIQSADEIIYLENGKIIAKGTFEEVRNSVPNFDVSASTMGL